MFKQINERENSSWTIFPTKLLLNTLSLTYFDYKSLISDIGKKIIVFNIFAWFHISLTFCKSNFCTPRLQNHISVSYFHQLDVRFFKDILKVLEYHHLILITFQLRIMLEHVANLCILNYQMIMLKTWTNSSKDFLT